VVVGSSSVLWHDWSRRLHRRACIRLLRHQRMEVQVEPQQAPLAITSPLLSRAERAHTRLTWQQRLACNARALNAGRVTIRLFGVAEHLATALELTIA
jgi:hypothetical protein